MNREKLYFTIKGKLQDSPIGLHNFTAPMIMELVKSMQDFLRAGTRVQDSEPSLAIEEGSLAISVEYAEPLERAFADYRYMVKHPDNPLAEIDPIRARVVQDLQIRARKNDDIIFTIAESDSPKNISSKNSIELTKDTDYTISEKDQWVDTVKYVYGEIIDMGGKTKPNLHMLLDDDNIITIDSNKEKLASDNAGHVYRKHLVKISAEQNLRTKELRNEKLIEFVNYNPKYDKEQFEEISKKVQHSWADVPDIATWVEEMRGNHAQEK